MPKAKRTKVVAKSSVKRNCRPRKESLIAKIRESVALFPNVFTFSLHNVRTNVLQKIRSDRHDDSRIFLGGTKVMQTAIGRDAETSQAPNLHKLSRFLVGMSGLFFTMLSKKELKEYFSTISSQVFARAGQPSAVKLEIPAGPLPFPHSMFDQLSKLGLRIQLERGVIVLLNDTTVCDIGDTLTAEAAHILKLFGLQTAEFKIQLTGHWSGNVARKIAVSS